MKTRIVFLSALFILLATDQALGCSCLPPRPPCEAYRETPAIFTALVTDIDPPAKDWYDRGYAHLSVERAFKGISETKIRMSQGTASGDCSVVFEKGTRYLIYAWYNDESKRFHTNSCTRSMPLEYAAEDLDYLEGLPDSNQGTRLSGIVIKTDYYDGGALPIPELISGVRVVAQREDGQRFEAITNKDGFYKILNLPPGRYRVVATLPSFLVHDSDKPDLVGVPSSGCATNTFYARTDGRLSGVLLDDRGQPAAGALVELLPLELSDKLEDLRALRPFIGRVEETDAKGRFEFSELKQGRYVLGVNMIRTPDARSPFQRTFFPGVQTEKNAAVISLGRGEKLEGYELRVSPRLPVREIKGIVVGANGKPIAKAFLSLQDSPSIRDGRTLISTETDARGHFTLKVLEGLEGWVHGSVFINVKHGIDVMSSNPIKVVANVRQPFLKLVVSGKPRRGVEILQ